MPNTCATHVGGETAAPSAPPHLVGGLGLGWGTGSGLELGLGIAIVSIAAPRATQLDDVGVCEGLEQGDLSQRRHRHALLVEAHLVSRAIVE